MFTTEQLKVINSKLSPHFSYREMARTDHRKYAEVNLLEALDFVPSITAVAVTLLEPIRAHFGAPVIVHSGFRGNRLNRAIKGSKTSQHMKGEAADFHVVGVALKDVWQWIAYDSGMEFGQLILEGISAGAPTWIHLSLGRGYRQPSKCGQVMTWDAERGYTLVRR